MKIAGDKTVEEWKVLEKKLKQNYNHNWEEAFSYFELRIDTRYVQPINSLINMKKKSGEGFAIVNLQCSLIETIESFFLGIIHKHPYFFSKNKKAFKSNLIIYESFFKRFNEKFNSLQGKDFYFNVRNCILHETQTKNNWKILAEGCLAYEFKEGFYILYRNNFQIEIENIIAKYKYSIINGEDFFEIPICELKENFIAKFNHICKES